MAEALKENDIEIPSILLPCVVCNRTFRPEALAKHVKVCEKSSVKKRRVFDSSKQRIQGTELAEFLPVLPLTKKPEKSPVRKIQSKWKEKHTELVSNIRAARDPSGDVPQPVKQSDHEQCPYCQRCFGPKAFDRHLEWCKEQQVRIQPKSPASLQAKERWEARTKYRAPLLNKSKRTLTKEKYSPQPKLREPLVPNCKTSSPNIISPPANQPRNLKETTGSPTSNFVRGTSFRGSKRVSSPSKKNAVTPKSNEKSITSSNVTPGSDKSKGLEDNEELFSRSCTITSIHPTESNKKTNVGTSSRKNSSRPQPCYSFFPSGKNMKLNDLDINLQVPDVTVTPCIFHSRNAGPKCTPLSDESNCSHILNKTYTKESVDNIRDSLSGENKVQEEISCSENQELSDHFAPCSNLFGCKVNVIERTNSNKNFAVVESNFKKKCMDVGNDICNTFDISVGNENVFSGCGDNNFRIDNIKSNVDNNGGIKKTTSSVQRHILTSSPVDKQNSHNVDDKNNLKNENLGIFSEPEDFFNDQENNSPVHYFSDQSSGSSINGCTSSFNEFPNTEIATNFVDDMCKTSVGNDVNATIKSKRCRTANKIEESKPCEFIDESKGTCKKFKDNAFTLTHVLENKNVKCETQTEKNGKLFPTKFDEIKILNEEQITETKSRNKTGMYEGDNSFCTTEMADLLEKLNISAENKNYHFTDSSNDAVFKNKNSIEETFFSCNKPNDIYNINNSDENILPTTKLTLLDLSAGDTDSKLYLTGSKPKSSQAQQTFKQNTLFAIPVDVKRSDSDFPGTNYHNGSEYKSFRHDEYHDNEETSQTHEYRYHSEENMFQQSSSQSWGHYTLKSSSGSYTQIDYETSYVEQCHSVNNRTIQSHSKFAHHENESKQFEKCHGFLPMINKNCKEKVGLKQEFTYNRKKSKIPQLCKNTVKIEPAKKTIHLPPINQNHTYSEPTKCQTGVKHLPPISRNSRTSNCRNNTENNHLLNSDDNYDPFVSAERQLMELLGISEDQKCNKSPVTKSPLVLSSPTSAFAKFSPNLTCGSSPSPENVSPAIPPPSSFEDLEAQCSSPPLIDLTLRDSLVKDKNRNPISLSSLSLCSSISIESVDLNRNGFRRSISNSAKAPEQRKEVVFQRSVSLVDSPRKVRDLSKGRLKMEDLLYGTSHVDNDRYFGSPIPKDHFDDQFKVVDDNDNSSNISLHRAVSDEETFNAEQDLLKSISEYENLFKSDSPVISTSLESLKLFPSLGSTRQQDFLDSSEKEKNSMNEASKSGPDSAYNSLNRKSPLENMNIDTGTRSSSECESSPSSLKNSAARFCHECGNRYPVTEAKFCCNCGARRLVI